MIAPSTVSLSDVHGVDVFDLAVDHETRRTIATIATVVAPLDYSSTEWFADDDTHVGEVLKQVQHLYPVSPTGEIDWRLANRRRHQAAANERQRRAHQARVARRKRLEEAEAEERADATQGRRLF